MKGLGDSKVNRALGWPGGFVTCVAAELVAAGSAPSRTARGHRLRYLFVHLPVGNLIDGPAMQR